MGVSLVVSSMKGAAFLLTLLHPVVELSTKNRLFEKREKTFMPFCSGYMNASGDCKKILNSLLCAPCHPSSSYFMEENGIINLCVQFAEEVFKNCKKYCREMNTSDLDRYFIESGVGVILSNAHGQNCFNGEKTSMKYLLENWEIVVIVVSSVVLVVLVAVAIIIIFVVSRRYAKKVDDKFEPEVCVIAGGGDGTAVELDPSMQSMQSLQSMPAPASNPASLAQTQMGGGMMMMSSGYGQPGVLDPSLMQTQAPGQMSGQMSTQITPEMQMQMMSQIDMVMQGQTQGQ